MFPIMIERSVRPNTHSKRMEQGVELAETERANTNPLHVLQATIKTARIKYINLLIDSYNQFATTKAIFELCFIESSNH